MTTDYYNAHPKKRGWGGIVALDYEVNDLGNCTTLCPYGKQTPAQKLSKAFRDIGVELGDADAVAKVGSNGCACCYYNCGKTYVEKYVLCGYKAKKTRWKVDELGLQIGTLKTPRKIK